MSQPPVDYASRSTETVRRRRLPPLPSFPPIVVAAGVLGVCVILAAWLVRPTAVGRYQPVPHAGNNPIVLDTVTGEQWERFSSGTWFSYGEPPPPPRH